MTIAGNGAGVRMCNYLHPNHTALQTVRARRQTMTCLATGSNKTFFDVVATGSNKIFVAVGSTLLPTLAGRPAGWTSGYPYPSNADCPDRLAAPVRVDAS